MLKALELIGFKSFADKTRFEFPPGITVIVGPNGSGKSNIVDAIKWVLGEQSVKSLRGKEMADVIFNGSVSRKGVNSAEATLTFDNSGGLLAIDTPEVHITRRVYRSGEGEYLINRQPCRLRDIRDLFAGTGAATEAYSVIEQGKVDVLLQASPRDRRLIFEEAAGISRFKLKKLEAARRLERVDQNLLRLSDIVEEVDNRLRSVRLQAAKARRYKEHADRLQELRTQVGLVDWRRLTANIESLTGELQRMRSDVEESRAKIEAREASMLELETNVVAADETIRECEGRIARNRERIAGHEATIEHERARGRDLEEEIARHRRHLAAMCTKAGNLEELLRATSAELAAAEAEYAQVQEQLAIEEEAVRGVSAELSALRAATDRERTEQLDALRQAAALGSQISALESQLAAAQQLQTTRQTQLSELRVASDELTTLLAEFQRKQTELAEAAQNCEQELRQSQGQLAASRRELAGQLKELSQLESRHSGAVERSSVLEELERRLEGVGAGVKEVLVLARDPAPGPFRQVRGLVADLLQVHVEMAALVEVALGSMAHHLVLASGGDLVEHLDQVQPKFQGRVGFVHLDHDEPTDHAERRDLQGLPGVLGRADRFVEASAEYQPLVRRLLGRTWFVEKLSHAVALAERAGRGLNFVTLAGEHLTADGTLVVGPKTAATGIISRRSELRALKATVAELELTIAAAEQNVARLEVAIAEQDEHVQSSTEAHQRAVDELALQRLKTAAAEEKGVELRKQIAGIEDDLQAAAGLFAQATAARTSAQGELAELEARLAVLQANLDRAAGDLGRLEQRRHEANGRVTERQVRLAKCEQGVDSFRRQREQLQRDRQERSRALADSRQQLESAAQRADQARQAALRAASELAELYLIKEKFSAEAVRLHEEREAFREERGSLAGEAQQFRQQIHALEEQIHAEDLTVGRLQHERTTLAERLREDYSIELSELEHVPSDEEQHQREAVENEIAELRRKLHNIGNVNLEALAELDELEARHGSLSAQHNDLSKAKASLEQIIGRINADSRRLFSETLETVRGHFQTLFRKLFGGGQADIVLEEGEDILECGIEIVARPPGKEPRSISLLSGGEKTLTCVALLLAIFRSRPSPFCVLDEVDAALDEANISRFVGVVKDFLAWTQFIVVTHSKKTMTCASTLYGVTMQESGISKRVSVRFEDVSEDGHIHQSAIEREAAAVPRSADDSTAAQAAAAEVAESASADTAVDSAAADDTQAA